MVKFAVNKDESLKSTIKGAPMKVLTSTQMREIDRTAIEEISAGFRVKDRYYHNIYLARVENYLCGIMKIKDESLKVGDKYFGMLIESLKK